jgi:PadR family transcriptional regulator, regulatory protein PadR
MGRTIRLSTQTRAILLAFLERASQWRYGYDLSRETDLKAGTLYPILIRLSDARWLEARWEEPSSPGRPPRHMYRLTQDGRSWARTATARTATARTATARAATKEAPARARATRPVYNEV